MTNKSAAERLEAALLGNLRNKIMKAERMPPHFIQISLRSSAPSRSAELLMVARKASLPAGGGPVRLADGGTGTGSRGAGDKGDPGAAATRGSPARPPSLKQAQLLDFADEEERAGDDDRDAAGRLAQSQADGL